MFMYRTNSTVKQRLGEQRAQTARHKELDAAPVRQEGGGVPPDHHQHQPHHHREHHQVERGEGIYSITFIF